MFSFDLAFVSHTFSHHFPFCVVFIHASTPANNGFKKSGQGVAEAAMPVIAENMGVLVKKCGERSSKVHGKYISGEQDVARSVGPPVAQFSEHRDRFRD